MFVYVGLCVVVIGVVLWLERLLLDSLLVIVVFFWWNRFVVVESVGWVCNDGWNGVVD